MSVRMLTVHCDQNDSNEITVNGCQKNKRNKKRYFRSPLWETLLSDKAVVGMFTNYYFEYNFSNKLHRKQLVIEK